MSNIKPETLQQGTHPLVVALDRFRQREALSWAELERQAGIGSGVMHAWRHGQGAITLQNLEAALGVVGYGLRPTLLFNLPAGGPQRAFTPGQIAQGRRGDLCQIDKEENGVLHGRCVRPVLQLQWNLHGRRLPLGGEDPFDLVSVVSEQKGEQ